MAPFFCQDFGNPHSRLHEYGWKAKEAIEEAQQKIACYIKTDASEILFTSGATESNLIAIRGILALRKKSPQKNRIITTAIEHPSVDSCCDSLRQEGVQTTRLPVNAEGLINIQNLEEAIDDTALLVSIIAVNNETGVMQPLEEIGRICKDKGVIFHSDITQAVGKVPLQLQDWNISMASFSSHKIYGPKGVGALYIRKDPPLRLQSIMPGGGQQQGLRGGTLPVPLCVGFGEACQMLQENFDEEFSRISKLSQQLSQGLLKIPLAHINGGSKSKVPHILNVSFPFVEGESIVMGLENVCLSTGSACSSDKLDPSKVLRAMKVDDLSIQSSIRFGIGRFTTEEEIQTVIEKTPFVVEKLRAMSPLWDMYQDGVDFSTIRWAS
jgi:cysteine desulfurase